MKYLTTLLLLILSGCSENVPPRPYQVYCIDNVSYIIFAGGGVTAQYTTYGNVKECK